MVRRGHTCECPFLYVVDMNSEEPLTCTDVVMVTRAKEGKTDTASCVALQHDTLIKKERLGQ